jgi:drug/metabolite transporter (DMT)-like permease
MPLSIALVLYFTQPISAAVVNFFLNKERLSPLEIISIFSAMIGVVILTCPWLLIPGKYKNQN